MKMLVRAALLLPALCACLAPAAAQQHASYSSAPAGYAPEQALVTVPAVSPVTGGLTEVAGAVTGTAATPTKGAASFTSGTATIGPLTPQLGRDIRVVLKGTWGGTFTVGTSADGCTTINPLTIGGASWGSYTANANEVVDEPTLSGIVYCATATITSGTLTYAVRQ